MVTKEKFTAVLRASGFTEEDMRRLHTEFESSAPNEHQEFLEFLHIPAEEIRQIREWSRAKELTAPPQSARATPPRRLPSPHTQTAFRSFPRIRVDALCSARVCAVIRLTSWSTMRAIQDKSRHRRADAASLKARERVVGQFHLTFHRRPFEAAGNQQQQHAGARASASAIAARKASMSARVVPTPTLARTAPGIVTSSPHSASWSSRAVWASSTPSRSARKRRRNGHRMIRAHGDPAIGQMGP